MNPCRCSYQIRSDSHGRGGRNSFVTRVLGEGSSKQPAPNPVIAGHDPQSIVVRRNGGYGSPRIAVRGRLVIARDDGKGTADSKGQSLRFCLSGPCLLQIGDDRSPIRRAESRQPSFRKFSVPPGFALFLMAQAMQARRGTEPNYSVEVASLCCIGLRSNYVEPHERSNRGEHTG
jgi:hypothetical protein